MMTTVMLITPGSRGGRAKIGPPAVTSGPRSAHSIFVARRANPTPPPGLGQVKIHQTVNRSGKPSRLNPQALRTRPGKFSGLTLHRRERGGREARKQAVNGLAAHTPLPPPDASRPPERAGRAGG
jgi:hypothetical protein